MSTAMSNTNDHDEWRARIMRALAELRPDPRSLDRRPLDEREREGNASRDV